jgi:hypothetical protein
VKVVVQNDRATKFWAAASHSWHIQKGKDAEDSKIRGSRCAKANLELAVFRSNSGIIPGALPSCTSKVHTRNFVSRFLWRLYIILINTHLKVSISYDVYTWLLLYLFLFAFVIFSPSLLGTSRHAICCAAQKQATSWLIHSEFYFYGPFLPDRRTMGGVRAQTAGE